MAWHLTCIHHSSLGPAGTSIDGRGADSLLPSYCPLNDNSTEPTQVHDQFAYLRPSFKDASRFALFSVPRMLSDALLLRASSLHRDEDSGVLSNATSAVLPADHVYNWSAFNKLLLLGMYAPVEEAHTCTEPAQAQLVKQQLQQLQAARQVRDHCSGADACAAGLVGWGVNKLWWSSCSCSVWPGPISLHTTVSSCTTISSLHNGQVCSISVGPLNCSMRHWVACGTGKHMHGRC